MERATRAWWPRAGAAHATLAILAILGFVAFAAPGCGQGEEDDEHDHDHDGHEGHGHAHMAIHGGTLVELGEHQANLEFVFDADEGRITFHILDAHAESGVRLTVGEIPVRVRVGEETIEVALVGKADDATGETASNTTVFSGADPALVGAEAFEITVVTLEVGGIPCDGLVIPYPAASGGE